MSQYQPLHNMANPIEDSSSDIEEKLLHQDYSTPRNKPSPFTTHLRTAEHITILILILLLSLNLLKPTTTTTTTDSNNSPPPPPPPAEPTPKFTSGPLRRTNKTFGSDHRYMTLDHTADYLWTPYLSDTYSEVAFPPYNATGHSLDQKYHEGAIAMLHSLHCLAGIRRALQRAREGEEIGIDWRADPHWPHCFQRLRESILCFADDTMELKREEDGSVSLTAFIEGSRDTRTCRDADALFAVYEKYKTEGRQEWPFGKEDE